MKKLNKTVYKLNNEDIMKMIARYVYHETGDDIMDMLDVPEKIKIQFHEEEKAYSMIIRTGILSEVDTDSNSGASTSDDIVRL